MNTGLIKDNEKGGDPMSKSFHEVKERHLKTLEQYVPIVARVHGDKPVSYTHLDVYKRQGVGGVCRQP